MSGHPRWLQFVPSARTADPPARDICGVSCELFLGDYDNYVSEIMDADGAFYRFRPQLVFLLPGVQRCKYSGALTDSRQVAQTSAQEVVAHLLELCRTVHERTAAEVLLATFRCPQARASVSSGRGRSPRTGIIGNG